MAKKELIRKWGSKLASNDKRFDTKCVSKRTVSFGLG